MKHFSDEDCADFANQTAAPQRVSEMQSHLSSGCTKCKQAVNFWQKFRELTRQEAGFEPDDVAVRLAVGSFALFGPRPRQGICREIAQLVFDSFREPLLAGVRGGHAPARRLLFRAGEVMIDLSMEPTSRQSHILLVGQVLDSAISGVGIVEVPVILLNGREMLAETETNLYGEFQLECSENKNLQISVGVTQDKDIFIPLDESIWKTPSEYRVN